DPPPDPARCPTSGRPGPTTTTTTGAPATSTRPDSPPRRSRRPGPPCTPTTTRHRSDSPWGIGCQAVLRLILLWSDEPGRGTSPRLPALRASDLMSCEDLVGGLPHLPLVDLSAASSGADLGRDGPPLGD